jgi:hypothetical protein
MSGRPPGVSVSVGLPDGGDDDVRQLVEALIKRAADRSRVNITVNIFTNPGEVNVYDKSRIDSLETKAQGDVTMTNDTYSAGQVGAMGPYSHAHNMTFQQIWSQNQATFDLQKLSEELRQLRNAMRPEATASDQDAALGSVALAEQAASLGDGPSVLKNLQDAGKWALSVAEKIGVGLATAAVKTALGM